MKTVSITPATPTKVRLRGVALASVIIALMLSLLLEALDQTIVGTAMPQRSWRTQRERQERQILSPTSDTGLKRFFLDTCSLKNAQRDCWKQTVTWIFLLASHSLVAHP